MPARPPLAPLASALALLLPLCAASAEPGDEKPAPNRLANEKSPYLRQHADNPVDWYPWGAEAFEKAAAENKPVFLSIGYSTCHWCHVMEHESFEDQETAAFLNQHFVSIKVDREERPDLDRIYMHYQQAVHGSGGWPLSLWLTPKKIPFFSGTYFPKKSRGGQTSFMDVLNQIRGSWEQYGAEITADGKRIQESMREAFATPPAKNSGQLLSPKLIDSGLASLSASYDPRFGGFGSRPKFPQPVMLDFLFDHYAAAGAAPGSEASDGLEMALETLRKMALGGIHDHIGGGFHRYSVDRFWHVPHFEKMLYDQAQIASLYLDAYHITADPFFESVARDIFAYVERDMSHPEGAFYSAEDADSLDPEGVHEGRTEGAFYLWGVPELQKLLGEERAPVFIAAYDVQERGNAPPGSDPLQEFTNKNILYRKKTTAGLAADFSKTPEQIEEILARSRAILLEARSRRPRPIRDDKILTAWNGLMISAYAKASLVLGESVFLERAERAATFIKGHLLREDEGLLLRSYLDGASEIQATADDYAFFIRALLDLYEASLDVAWLELAVTLQDRQNELLLDDEHGGYFDSPENQTDLILRLKNTYDGARPSANSISAQNLVRLSALIKSDAYDDALDRLLEAFAGKMQSSPVAHIAMITAYARRLATPAQVAIAGKPEDPATAAILEAVRSEYHPNKVVLLLDGGRAQEYFASRNELFAAFKPLDGTPTLYLCRNYTCQKPTSDPAEIAEQLDSL
ncbi:MAG: thioredoxin domain-containing protein [Verrucomicrobiales bacterium]